MGSYSLRNSSSGGKNMSRDPVDSFLEYYLREDTKPYDPIFNPHPHAVSPPITPHNPHQQDEDFKPATGDGNDR